MTYAHQPRVGYAAGLHEAVLEGRHVLRSGDWFQEAEGELQAARHLLEAGDYSWCCFTSQQAAETALKAVLEHLRAQRTGHNLVQLCDQIAQQRPVPPELRAACADLNLLYISTRYPDAFPSGSPVQQFIQSQAEEAVREAEEVVGFARRALGL